MTMNGDTDKKPELKARPVAWEPLTPKGVAAFALSGVGSLWLVQFIVAVLASILVAVVLSSTWFPVIREAIHEVPGDGNLKGGRFTWNTNTPVQLAQNTFLGIAIDTNHTGRLGRDSHLQVEFGEEDVRLYSMFGYVATTYPVEWNIPVNQFELESWWGAWQPMILVSTIILSIVGLMASWSFLATIYCIPVWLISFFQNRDLTFLQSWRLAGASLMPGALFMTFSILAYGWKWIDLIQLGGMTGMHFIIGWIYVVVSPLFCPKGQGGAKRKGDANPFIPETAVPAHQTAVKPKKGNPFSPG